MWKLLVNALKSGVARARVSSSKPRPPFYVHRAVTQTGSHDLVSLLSSDTVFEYGLVGDAIVGECIHLLEEDDQVTTANFRPNRAFVRLLHDVIARQAPLLPGLQADARRQRTGWVYVIDARTATPDGHVPPQDVIGGFEVHDGEVVPDSYRPNGNHQLLTEDGLFGLDPVLHEKLMERINELIVANSRHTTG
jgi:hypothetical protein